MGKRITRRRGFSLIELVIVVVIIGIIAAIAIPRMSRGSAGAADSALAGDMAEWRQAVDHYQAEHGNYPDPANIANQLTQYTDGSGGTNASPDQTHIYGPYLRVVPPLPVGSEKGSSNISPEASGAGAPAAVVPGGFGWVYDPAGSVYPNTGALTDTSGKAYTSY